MGKFALSPVRSAVIRAVNADVVETVAIMLGAHLARSPVIPHDPAPGSFGG